MSSPRIVSSSVASLLSVLVGLLTGLVLTPFLLAKLGEAHYGLWVLIGAFMGYGVTLDFGVATAVARFMSLAVGSGDGGRAQRILTTGLRLVGGIVLLLLPLAAGLIWLSKQWTGPESQPLVRFLLILAAAALAFEMPARVFEGVLTAHVRLDLSGTISVLRRLVYTGLVIGLLSVGFGIHALAWITFAMAVAAGLAMAWAALRVGKGLSLRLAPGHRDERREMLDYGVPIFLASLADIVRWQGLLLVAGGIAGAVVVAHLNVALVLVRNAAKVISATFRPLMPMFGQMIGGQDPEALKKYFLGSLKLSVPFSAWVFGGLAVLGSRFIDLWVGPEFQSSYLPLVILGAGLFVALAQNPTIQLIQGLGLAKFYLWTNWIEAILNISLCLAVGYRFGMIGLATAFAVPLFVVKLGLQPWVVVRKAGWSAAEYYGLFLRCLAKTVLCLALAGLPVYMFMRPTWLGVGLGGVLFSILYWLLFFMIGWSRKDRAQIKRQLADQGRLSSWASKLMPG